MKRFLSGAFLLISTITLYGVPARPGLMTLRQPDGTEVKLRLVGDELHHYYLSEEGYLLVNEEGYFYYADIQDDGIIVRSDFRLSSPETDNPGLRSYLSTINRDDLSLKLDAARKMRVTRSSENVSEGLGLIPDSSYPTTGEQRALVILAEFPDRQMTLDNPYDYFSRMLNEPGFSEWGGTGSARDYFLECSNGLFSPHFDLYGPVTLPGKMAYYGANDSEGNDRRPAQMIADACAALDEEVDFSIYDLDNDGVIDNVFVFYAGEGEAAGGEAETIWPHSWFVTAGVLRTQVFDGVLLDRYACSCEWVVENNKGRPDGVGTFIHEFSHVLGLPDLYATNFSKAFTPDVWSALDCGSYNNGGCTPPLYSAFERYSLGWLTPFDLSDCTSVSLSPIGTNEAGIFLTKDMNGETTPNEYFLVENRQQTGWDTYLPGHGMLVWHIDYNEKAWWNNEVNNKASHQYVDLVEADGKTDFNKNRASDTFPGINNITSFGDDTTPSSRSWNNVPSGISLKNIAEKEGLITFDVDRSSSASQLEIEADIRWEIRGSKLCLSGVAPRSEIRLYDLTGILIAATVADENNEASIPLSHHGIFILHTPSGTLKISYR